MDSGAASKEKSFSLISQQSQSDCQINTADPAGPFFIIEIHLYISVTLVHGIISRVQTGHSVMQTSWKSDYYFRHDFGVNNKKVIAMSQYFFDVG